MRRLLVCTVALVLLVSSVASATNVRVLTLGDNNVILRDDANIYLFPSTINNYKKLVVGEFGRSYTSKDFRTLGIHWQIGDENPFVLGTYLHNDEVVLPSPFSTIYFNFWDSPLPNKRIDLFGGTMLGETPVGFHLGLVGSETTVDRPHDKNEAYFVKFNCDVGATLAEGKADVTAGFAIASFTDIGTALDGSAYDQTKSEGSIKMHFLARYFLEKNPRYTIVPHIGGSLEGTEFSYYGLNVNDPEEDSTKTWDAVNFNIGSGFVWTPFDNALCLFDAGIAIHNSKIEVDPVEGITTEFKKTTLTVPYFHMGFEGNVFKWMDVRFGATSNWVRIKDTDDYDYGESTYEYFMSYPSNGTYLGFGFHWNRLHVDTYTDPELFLDGFNFISGRDNDMNFMISVFYDLD